MCNHNTAAHSIAKGGDDTEGNHIYICGDCGGLVVAYWSPAQPEVYGHVFDLSDVKKVVKLMKETTIYNQVDSEGIEV